jgi:predicted permease
MFDSLRNDARYAARGLARSPAFSLTSILSLAIGIGGSAAVYSLVNALLLTPPPGITEPDRVVYVGRTTNGQGFDTFSYPTFADLRDRNRTLSGLAAIVFETRPASLRGPDGGEAIQVGIVSANFFSVLGTRPATGRFFLDEEDRAPRTHAVAVLSHRYWTERFGADPSILERGVVLNGTPFTVIGIAETGFHGPSVIAPDMWIPVMASPWIGVVDDPRESRRSNWLIAVGRLRENVSRSQATADLATVMTQLAQDHAGIYEGLGTGVQPVSLFPGEITRMVALFMTFLFALTGMVIVIAGTNVAGMLVARAAARRREIAVRLAIGASRARLVRQLVTESAVLFAAAGLAGALVARWLLALLLSFVPSLPVQVSIEPAVDWRVVVFALGVSLVAGVIAGLAPALQSTRPSLAPELRTDVGGAIRRHRLQSTLLVSQVAFSMLLLVVAGLFARALTRATAIDPGFDPANVHIATVDLRLVNHTPETGRQFFDRMLAEAQRLPGVEAAAFSRMIPLGGGGMGLGGVLVDGHPGPDSDGSWGPDWNIVTPAYFDVLRIPLARGRGFTDADREGTPAVAIMNETLASAIWPNEDAVGKTFRNEGRTVTVVGIARNAKYRTLGESPRQFIYVPLAQSYLGDMSLFVRTSSHAAMAPVIRRMVATLDPSLPVLVTSTMEEQARLGLFPQRIALWTASTLGGLALLLALIGIYGLTSFEVAQRKREIGIRIALGSSSRDVLRLIAGQGARLALIGVVIGVGGAIGATRLLEGLLYGVSGADPVALVAAAALLLGAALAASWAPARRAAGLNPMIALRQE